MNQHWVGFTGSLHTKILREKKSSRRLLLCLCRAWHKRFPSVTSWRGHSPGEQRGGKKGGGHYTCGLLDSVGPAPTSRAQCISQSSCREGKELSHQGARVAAKQSHGTFWLQQENLWQGPEAQEGHEGRLSCAFLKSTRPPESCEHKEAGKVERIWADMLPVSDSVKICFPVLKNSPA